MSFSQSNEINRIRAAFEEARAARQAGDAEKAIREWSRVLELTEDATDREQRQARMASSSESGVVYQELGDLRRSRDMLLQAATLAEELAADGANGSTEDRVGDALAVAGVHVNLAGLYAGAREPEQGVTHAEKALAALDAVGQHPARTMLEFAGLMQLGTARLLLSEYGAAKEKLKLAVDRGIALVTEGQSQVLPQLVECGGRVFAAAKAQGQAADALQVVEQVSRIAIATFEATGQPALEIFVNAQMHRINALIEVKRYAEAEDQLWHMIDGSGQGNILISAPDFYTSIWKHDDADLQQGGLPRDEIAESWQDAIERAAKREADPVAIEVMWQRFRLHTQDAVEETQKFLAQHSGETDTLAPLAAALMRGLGNELRSRG